ncbi:MAG: hypothetical protein HOO92_10360 [Methylococcaceae bacterium]|nr:hypothetical protein [Methylococcaceae bacterium]
MPIEQLAALASTRQNKVKFKWLVYLLPNVIVMPPEQFEGNKERVDFSAQPT